MDSLNTPMQQSIGDNSNYNNQYNDCVFNDAGQSIDETVKTILDLMGYIAQNTELTDGDLDNAMPDPELKIFRRFAEYCDEIKEEIVNSSMYAKAQKEAETIFGLDKINIGKITAYLKRESRKMLRENDNNPMNALDKLTDYFENILKNTRDTHFERNAIRYYLIGQIPKCNVFPNPSKK